MTDPVRGPDPARHQGASRAEGRSRDEGRPGDTRAGSDPLEAPVQQVSLWNVANGLTVLRMAMVPAFVVLLFADGGHEPGWRALAWVVFAIAAVTDLFDGDLARRRGIVTDFGKIADPIADKALTGSALIGLSLLDELPWWVTIVILVREVGVTLLRFWVIRHGVIPASRGGKLKTLLQGIAIGLYVLPLAGAWRFAAGTVMAAALVVTVLTGLDYVGRAVALRRAARRPAMGRARVVDR